MVEIRDRRHNQLVTAIFNRGIQLFDGRTQRVSFIQSEELASWWSALACFAGPVVNRPSCTGISPALVPTALTGTATGFLPPRTRVSTLGYNGHKGLRVNVHRVRDGKYVGRWGELPLQASEVYAFTSFDPRNTLRMLFAGESIINLNSPDGRLPAELARPLDSLVEELKFQNATFSLIVLELDGIAIRILDATAFPQLHHYEHHEREVHKALHRYLKP